MALNDQQFFWFSLGLLGLALVYLALAYPAVGGDGDTIMHYFFAEQALREPRLFFDLWAKPVFTFLAAPSTLAGFSGIKIFNILAGLGAVALSAHSAKNLGLRYYAWLPILALISPAFPFYLLSGLTEPLAAFWLAAILFFLSRRQPIPAYILASFLPYLRSEAKVLLFLFILYALWQKHYRHLPWLAFGSLLIGLLGSRYHQDVFWILDSPYRSGPSPYGSGPWYHYLRSTWQMLGPALSLLLLLGIAAVLSQWWRRGFSRSHALWLLILALFIGLLSAHSTVWALGIFASAGLERVLILVFPAAWLLSLRGIDLLSAAAQPLGLAFAKKLLAAFLVLAPLLSTGFSASTRAYWAMATQLPEGQKLVAESLVPYLKHHYPEAQYFVADEPYLGIALGFNMKDDRHRVNWNAVNLEAWFQFREESLFIWDDNFVPSQYGLTWEKVTAIPWLVEEKRWQSPSGRRFALFRLSDSPAELQKRYANER